MTSTTKFARKKLNPKKWLEDLRKHKTKGRKKKKIPLLHDSKRAFTGRYGKKLVHLHNATFVFVQAWGRYSAVPTEELMRKPELSCGCGCCVRVTCPTCKKVKCGKTDWCNECGRIWT